ncbi:ABC transporter permease [Rhodocyclus purpureus]|uniref:ABC transporter permease n=1 Tax=Rhodocyclus purpureus TaxID=1067 RepID=UPI001912E9C0|nr:FtsX-like permease family protein [Rhodocyclus purpureus]MBK5915309.1 ABC transporter permease [Rhodocyclus purpureus]
MNTFVTDLRLSIRNLSRNLNRSLVAGLTVLGGVVAYLLAGGFINFIFFDLREATIHSQLGHVQIVRPGYFEKGIADPYSFLLPGASEELKAIEALPEVSSVTPRLAFSGLLSHGEVTIPFIGEGVDPERERPISKRLEMIAGRDLARADAREAILGAGLARSVGVVPGDSIVLLATAANGGASAVELEVVGIFRTVTKEFDDNALRISIAQARKLMRVEGATSWVASLQDTEQTGPVVERLRARLPVADFQVLSWSDLADFYNKTVALFSKQVGVMKLIIGLIIVLTISNTQTMSVLERTTEIGTSMAIGARRSEVMRLFLTEGALLGLTGGAAGVAIGTLLAALISAIGVPMPPPPGMAYGYDGRILVSSALATDALVLALVTTLLASVMPAWRASRMNIVDALRCNQ